MKYRDLARRKVQHICIFGDPKSGKSELAMSVATLPFVKKVIWVSMDNGHEVISKLPLEAQDKVDIIVLPDTKEFPVAIDTCLKMVSGAPISICDAHGQVACSVCKRAVTPSNPNPTWTNVTLRDEPITTVIVFDHISQLADSAMNFILKGKKDDYFPEWEHFRLQGTLMGKFLMNIQQAPYNCICLSHVCETEMEDGSKKLVPLVGTVPFSRNTGKYFDHIVYCRVANKKHAFGSATTYVASVLTGSRSDVAVEEEKVVEGKRASLLPFFDASSFREDDGVAAILLLENIQEKVVAVEEQREVVDNSVESVDNTESIREELEVEEVVKEAVPEEGEKKSTAELAKERLRLMREKSASIAAGKK